MKGRITSVVCALVIGLVVAGAAGVQGAWVAEDINTTGGSTSGTVPGPLTITGDGADIWSTSDGFHYFHDSVTGDFTAVARIVSQQNTDGQAKAGLMARPSMASSATFVSVVITPASGVNLLWRDITGSGAWSAPLTGSPNSTAAPVWLRLRRAGQMFYAAWAPDVGGSPGTWSAEASHLGPWIPMTTELGLAVCSRVAGTLCNVVADGVQITTVPHPTRTWHVNVANVADPLEDGSAAHPFDRIQEAIDRASDGDTIQVAAGTYNERLRWEWKPVSILGAGAGVTTVNATGGGRCFYIFQVPAGGLLEGFTFTGGSYTDGAGLRIQDSTLTLRANIVTGNATTSGGGGGLYLYRANATLEDNVISNNTSPDGGGGLFLNSSAPVLRGNTIQGNRATTNGGGLHLASNSAPKVRGNTITGNTAQDGGGVYCTGSSPELTDNNDISSNTATRNGGGLYLASSSGAVLTANTITGNVAQGTAWGSGGGGLYLTGSSPALAGNTITSNQALNGGGLTLRAGSAPTLTGNTVSGNSATSGGGLLFDNSSPTLKGNTIASNSAASGGGVYMWNSNPVLVPDDAGTRNRITGNLASNGAGLFIQGSIPTSPTLTSNDITGNTATGAGGGLTLWGSSPTLTMNDISGNSAGEGAGLHLWASSATLTGNTITGNTATASGGGLRLDAGSAPTLTGNDISSNQAAGGGGLIIWSSSPALTGNTISGNTALGDHGGGVYLYQSGGTLTGNRIAGNSSPNGGGLSIRAGSTTVLSGNIVEANTCTSSGGGFFLSDSSPTMTGNTIAGNTCGWHGGGMYMWQSSPTLEENTIASNIAQSGGGLFISSGSSPSASRNAVTGNSAILGPSFAAGGGGGVTIWGSTPTLRENTITGNSAADNGGGVYAYVASPTLEANQITDNTALGGGGVFSTGGAGTLRANIIQRNSAAAYGGGMHLDHPSEVVEENVIADNAATSGGGVYGYLGAPTLRGNTIANNAASNDGGGVFLNGVGGSLSSSTIQGNQAADAGGGVYLLGASSTLDGNTITANQAVYGGGIRLWHADPVLRNNTITSNAAEGIRCGGSSPLIENNTIAGNAGNGIFLAVDLASGGDPAQAHLDVLSQPTITGNSIAGNGQWGIRCEDTAATNAATLEADNTLGTNVSGQVLQLWRGLVQVVDYHGSPAAGASASVYNHDGDTTPDYGSPWTASAQGYAPPTANPVNSTTWPWIAEFQVGNDGVRATLTPQALHASLGAAYGDASHSWNGRYQIPQVRLNTPPVAIAPDQAVEQATAAGTSVTLDGSGSSDPDDEAVPLTYSWSEDGEEIAIGVAPTVTLSLGAHTLLLTVTDDLGYTGTDTVLITVQDTTAPVLGVPDPVTAEQTSRDGTPVGLGEATATDICDATPVVTAWVGYGTPQKTPAPAVFPLGTTPVTWTATDASGNIATATQTVTVVDTTAPQLVVPQDVIVDQTGPYTPVDLGLPTVRDICDANPVVRNDAPVVLGYGTAFPVGTWDVTWTVVDASGNGKTGHQTVTVRNLPPSVVVPADAQLLEGGTFSGSGSSRDPGNDACTATVDYGDGSGVQPLPLTDNTFALSHRYLDNGTYTVTVTVIDEFEASGSGTLTVTVANVAPTVGPISAPAEPRQVNIAVNASAAFTDPGVLDTHTAIWDWGDGSTSSGTVAEANGSGSVTGSHSYAEPGVYTLHLTVTDKDGGSGTSLFQYVVAYDPEGGFVTGGGWITSPPGAYAPNPALIGRANFGFNSKYHKGATVPTGQTEFQFKVGNLNFHSSSYDWLVISGAKARYKGIGTINGAGDYRFLLTAIDGQVNGGGGVDRFRIRIWDRATGATVYDNQMGEADDSDATTALGGGSIVIHKE